MAEQKKGYRKTTSFATLGVMALLMLAVLPATVSSQGSTGEKKEPKEGCTYTLTSVDSPVDTVVGPVGTALGPLTFLQLDCPHHIELGEPQYGYKDCRSPIGLECKSPLPDIVVEDLGRVDEPKLADSHGNVTRCGWTRTWQVSAPSVNTYVFWFRVHTLKDEDCDKKPDDWNKERFEPLRDDPDPTLPTVWRQTNSIPPTVIPYGDGALDGDPCHWDNTFYSGRLSFSKPTSDGGGDDPTNPPPFPGYNPAPDGEINECDWQTFEYQWRQWN